MSDANNDILVSPNPLIKSVDDHLDIALLNADPAAGPFDITLSGPAGELVDYIQSNSIHARINLATNASTGIYTITATSADGHTWAEQTNVAVLGAPFLDINPNPITSNTLHAKVGNCIAGFENLVSLVIYDFRGNVMQQAHGINAGAISMDISSLPANLYMLSVTDGTHLYTQTFSKQ